MSDEPKRDDYTYFRLIALEALLVKVDLPLISCASLFTFLLTRKRSPRANKIQSGLLSERYRMNSKMQTTEEKLKDHKNTSTGAENASRALSKSDAQGLRAASEFMRCRPEDNGADTRL